MSILFRLLSFILSLSFHIVHDLPPHLHLYPHPPQGSNPVSFHSSFKVKVFNVFTRGPRVTNRQPNHVSHLPMPRQIIRNRIRMGPMFPFTSSSQRQLCFHRISSMRKWRHRRFQRTPLHIKRYRCREHFINTNQVNRLHHTTTINRCRGANRIILINLSTTFRSFRSMRFHNFNTTSNHHTNRPLTNSFTNTSHHIITLSSFRHKPNLRMFTTLRRNSQIQVRLTSIYSPLSQGHHRRIQSTRFMLTSSHRHTTTRRFIIKRRTSNGNILSNHRSRRLNINYRTNRLLIRARTKRRLSLFTKRASIHHNLIRAAHCPLCHCPFRLLGHVGGSHSSARQSPSYFRSVILCDWLRTVPLLPLLWGGGWGGWCTGPWDLVISLISWPLTGMIGCSQGPGFRPYFLPTTTDLHTLGHFLGY